MSDYKFNYIEYKKTIGKKSSPTIIILTFVIIFLFGIALFLHPSNNGTYEFYFVQVDSFETYSQANNLSQELQTNNAPGYIFYEGKYRVLASFFTNYDDAEKVAKNLETNYKNATVFTITSKQINKNNYNFDPNKTIKNLILSTNKIINKLNDLNISFDKQDITYNEVSIKLIELERENDKIYNDFYNFFKKDYTLNSAKKYAQNINLSLQFLKECKEQNISYNLKNELIKIVINHSSFLSCF